jgi:hypothetical protein
VIGALVPTIVAFLRKHSSLAVGVSAAGVVKEAGRGECEACGRPAGRASPVSPEQEQPDAATTRNSALREKALKRIGRLLSVPHASVTRLATERQETIDETVSRAIRALRHDTMARDLATELTNDETAWLGADAG